MLECLKFLLSLVLKFVSALFKVNVGFTSLGVVFCIVFILFPIILAVVNFIKTSFIQELDERYDESRPRETWSSNEHQFIKLGNGKTFHTNHVRSRSRRYRL